MRRTIQILASVALVACGEPTPTPPTDQPFQVVPIAQSLPDGGSLQVGLRLVTSISVEHGAPIQATVDTGSAGLQLLADLVDPKLLAGFQKIALVQAEFSASGIQANGYITAAHVSFGDATTPAIPVAVFTYLSCVAGSTVCPTDAGPLAGFLFDGYPALLGIGMRSTESGGLGNPIAQLAGEPSFIVEAPSFGGDAGILRIAPAAAEIAGYQTVQLPSDRHFGPLQNGVSGWNDLAIPTCVEDTTNSVDYCANGLLDTGTPIVEIAWSGQTDFSVFPPSTDVTLVVGTSDGGSAEPAAIFSVTVGSPPQYGLDGFILGPPLPDVGSAVILGLPVFSRYNVLFDQMHGRIGLLAH